jgi:hypothetical protein
MSGRLAPVELCCDAPPYEAVRACEKLGLHSPLDVRWMRVGNLRKHRRGPARSLGARWWAWLRGRRHAGRSCGCHRRLPEMRWYRFVYPAAECDYVLGQCRRCSTVYWDELQSLLKGSPYAITFKAIS